MVDIIRTPENQLQLMLLIRREHPELWIRLRAIKDFELQLAEICTYCNIVIDATLNVDDMNRLFDTLYKELKDKSLIVIPSKL